MRPHISLPTRALIIAAILCVALSDNVSFRAAADSLEETLQRLGPPKPVEEKAPKPLTGPLGRTDEDIRRQKEDAAESLNKTLREIDDRARTRALEDGRAIIVE